MALDFRYRKRWFTFTTLAFWEVLVLSLIGLPPVFAIDNELPRIEIRIDLTNGDTYIPANIWRQFNDKLNARYPVTARDSTPKKLSVIDRAALIAAREAGWLDVDFSHTAIVLRLPDPQNPDVRREQRRRIARLFGQTGEEWPKELGLHLPAKFEPTRRTLVLIHGFNSGIKEIERLALALKSFDCQVAYFDYPSLGPLEFSGKRLAEELAHFERQYPAARYAIVAQSMGGLVARYALEASEVSIGNATDLVTLGTPHQGSEMVALYPWLELSGRGPPNTEESMLRDGLGEAIDDMRPGSRFLKQLNARPRAKQVRYHVAIGQKGLLTPAAKQAVEQELAKQNPDNSTALRRQLMAVLSSAEVGNGDGAVATKSARLSGSTTEKQFPLHHLELIYLDGDSPTEREVIQWIRSSINLALPSEEDHE